MAPKVLFDGPVEVSYRFIHLDSTGGGWDEEVDHRAGQRNGLAGAAQAGFVDLVVGTHSGEVPLRIELYRNEPRVDERWDEIVEVSCDLRGRRLEVTTFDGAYRVRRTRQNGPHRVRYCALRFDDDRDRGDDEVALDRYLVQLWPAPMAPDAVVKQASEAAAYWHGEAGGPPGRNPTPYERAEAELAAKAARDRDEHDFAHQQSLWRWGGREPSPRLRRLDPGASQLAVHHRDLADLLEALAPDRQRVLALEVARRACAGDHDSPVDWTPALDALGRGLPLPPPFDDEEQLRAAMFGPSSEVTYEVTLSAGPAPRTTIHTGVGAAAAVRGAADPDPFAAVLLAVEAASWSAPDEDAFFAGVADLVR